MTTQSFTMPFGEYKGTRIKFVPTSYLKWMVSERTICASVAETSLLARGVTKSQIKTLKNSLTHGV